MWTFVIIIGVIALSKFIYDTNQQKQKVSKEGGMLHKYRILVDALLSGDQRTKIHQVTGDSMVIGLSNMGGSTMFFLTQTYGKLTVQWKVESPMLGKHKLEWEFDEYLDQEKMMQKISNDLTKYQNNVMTANGLPDINE